ncbi:MAG: hypothetical protein AAGE52_12390 [Myxococcota bacterium]
MFRTAFLVAVLLVSAPACLGWEEAPEGATGFLVVDDLRLEGTIDGAAIDSVEAASGYCTELGWHVEITARAGEREVMNVIDVSDLSMAGREASVRFVSGGSENLTVAGLEEPGRLKLQACAGSLDAPEYEAFATNVNLQILDRADNDVGVEYVAMFENGDRVEGQFEMEMPVTD